VGYFRARLSVIERGVLIVAACIMTFDPIDFSLLGVAPMLVSGLLVARHVRRNPQHPAGAEPRRAPGTP
jgi:hypothetical protein